MSSTTSQPIRLHLSYFAKLREEAGLSEEAVTSSAATPAALYAELRQRHGFTLETSHLRVAINDDFAPWDQALREGDRLVFIQPVAGG
jgi:molybdopterin converting factor small subunit